ncbi:hypothetical protein, partial [Robbsia andropogonis]|uniref:hypothetical protein n=1 Tax=Robbsia andropogonis TaxID=28092 RepID=UPI00209EBB24
KICLSWSWHYSLKNQCQLKTRGDSARRRPIERNEQTRAQATCHRFVSQAVSYGFLPRAKDCVCVDCGLPARHYDHRDYNKPLDVEPVCVSCNLQRGAAKPFARADQQEQATA